METSSDRRDEPREQEQSVRTRSRQDDSFARRLGAPLLLLGLLGLALPACGDGDSDGGSAPTPDVGLADSGPRPADQGADLGPAHDEGVPDQGSLPEDQGLGDQGPGDSGPSDLGLGDQGPGDSGPGDLGRADQGAPDLGPPDPFAIPQDLPRALPFELTRPAAGEAPSAEQRAAFTRKLTLLLRRTRFFDWLLSTSHGVHASTGRPDYSLWWQDVEAVKTGDLVTFRHNSDGGAHNVMIPSSKVLAQSIAGTLSTGDTTMARVAEQYAKALVATCKGMVFDENDPEPYLMARNIATFNHEYQLADGRRAAVDYTLWYNSYESWNAQRIHYPNNPYWGDIWVTNMRSKDDVAHIVRTAAWLPYLVQDTQDEALRAAGEEAWRYVVGFSRDIVDHDWKIRTKDAQGQPYVPDQDLASYSDYDALDPRCECTNKLTAALLGYGDARQVDCGDGIGFLYEGIAVAGHYFNYAIIRNYHMGAAALALVRGQNELARGLIEGLGSRATRYLDPSQHEAGRVNASWDADVAVYLLQASAVGMPLTGQEAQHIRSRFDATLDAFLAWDRWNLWDPAVPDGVYNHRGGGYRPPTDGHRIGAENLAFFFEHCWSPFRNPAGVELVDCDLLQHPERWPEE